jgi:hypothetical protein
MVPVIEEKMTSTSPTAIRLQALLWMWGSRLLLLAVLALAVSELFVFKGYVFRLVTPATAYAVANPPQLPAQGQEGEGPKPFDPTDPSSVPEARLPKELATAEMQTLIKDVLTLTKDLERLGEAAPKYSGMHGQIDTIWVRDGLWEKLVTKGFNNTETPGMWYRVAGGRSGTIEAAVIAAIALPVGHVRARILGGVATTADAAYINGVRAWIEPHIRWLDAKQKEMDRLIELIRGEDLNIRDPYR